jgi:hypothetical protein
MAVINRNSLVHNGVFVVRDVVTGTMGNGIDAVTFQTTAMPFSTRLPSQRFPHAVQEPWQRRRLADDFGADSPAVGAGRPGSRPCVLASRPGAITAGLTSPKAWLLASTGSCSTAGLGLRRMKAQRPEGDRSRRCLHASNRAALRVAIPNGMENARAYKRDEADPAWFNPADGEPPASTRG